MFSGFHPKITLSTRITDTSNTLIDNILTYVYDDNHMCQAFLLIRYQIISQYLLVTIKQPHFAKNRSISKLKLKMSGL